MAITSKKDLEAAKNLGAEIEKALKASDNFSEKIASNFARLTGNVSALAVATDKFDNSRTKANKQQLKDQVRINKAALNFRNHTKEALQPLQDQLDNVQGIYEKYRDMVPVGGKFVGVVAAGVAVATLLANAVADTRKELGISSFEAGQITAQLGAASAVGKLFGLSSSDIKESFTAISGTLGGIEKATAGSAFNFAMFSMKLGVAPQQAADLLKQMESVSGASRESLKAQLESTKELIRQQGVAPGPVLRDIAENSEFFAKFSKAGSNNMAIAAANARKLGLNLSTVSQISESLLDFESSINAQMEASVLLGREINTDRARQLAFTGDQVGLMNEVRRIVGSEAEFNAMNVMQRKALGDAIGVNVSELSRLVAEEESAVGLVKKFGLGIIMIGTGIGAAFGFLAGMISKKRLMAGIVGAGKGAATVGGLATGGVVGAKMMGFQGLPAGTGVNITGGAAMAHAGETIVRTESINMDKTNQLIGDLVALNERMIRKIDGIGVS